MTRRQMGMTSLGLGFHYAKVLIYLIGILVYMVCIVLMSGALSPQSAEGAVAGVRFLSVILSLAYFTMAYVGPGLGATGSILCCWVPGITKAKPFVITSLALDIVATVLPLLSMLIAGAAAFTGGFRETAPGTVVLSLVFTVLSALCTMAAFILFMLFLRQLATFMDDSGTANEAMGAIVHYVWLILAPILVVGLLFMLIFFISRDFASFLFGSCIFWLTFIGGAIVWFVFVLKLLFRILNIIASMRAELRSRYNV
jgi:hypothetical protein